MHKLLNKLFFVNLKFSASEFFYINPVSKSPEQKLQRFIPFIFIDRLSSHLPNAICFLSVYHTYTKLDTSCNLSQIRHPRRVDCFAPLWGSNSIKCFSQGYNMHCPVQELNPESAILQLPTCAHTYCRKLGC